MNMDGVSPGRTKLCLSRSGDAYRLIWWDYEDGESHSTDCSDSLEFRRILEKMGSCPNVSRFSAVNLNTMEPGAPSDRECLQQLRYDILQGYDEEQFREDLKLVLGAEGPRKFQELSDYLDDQQCFQSLEDRMLKILGVLEITEIDDE